MSRPQEGAAVTFLNHKTLNDFLSYKRKISHNIFLAVFSYSHSYVFVFVMIS